MSWKSLEDAERARQAVEVELDSRKSAQERNRLGQFATPGALAVEMAELGAKYLPTDCPIRFMEPGLGTGVLFFAAQKVLSSRLQAAWGYEIDPAVAQAARKVWEGFGLDVRHHDFCTATPPAEAQKANLVLCNPPYVRHHHLAVGDKVRLRKELEKAGFWASGLAGLYCYFLLLAHRWMAPGGVGVWLVPAEVLDVNYGKCVKEYLVTDVTLLRMHRFNPENVQFSNALVSSVVILFRKAPPSPESLVQLTMGGSLSGPEVVRSLPHASLRPTAKWGILFSKSIDSAMQSVNTLTIGQLFSVKRGLATGANEFFIMERRRAEALSLPGEFLRAILPSPREVPGDIIEANGDGFPKGLRELVLLDCDLPANEVRKQAPAVAEYLEAGKLQGISERYLPSHRRLWYSQEVRPPAPILCTYMGRQSGGRALRFIRNKSAATAPNVYLLLYPRPLLASLLETNREAMDCIFQALTETASHLVRQGRVYGGGLNKIEPKELESVQLPSWLQEKYPHLNEFRWNSQSSS